MLVGIAAIGLVDALLVGLGSNLGTAGTVIGALLGGAATIVLYRIVMHRLAGRQTPELARAGWLGDALVGASIGAGFVLGSIAVITLLGGYTIRWHPIDAVPTVSLAVAVNVGAAIVEEAIFRGFAFQAIERLGGGRWLGLVLAVALTSAFFGGAHLLNPGATLWSGFAIALEAGVLLGAAFLWKRRLWLVIGLHAAWNIVEGLLGIAVSGHREPGLFLTTAHGPALLTGGAFGLEASIVPVVIGVALAVFMLTQRRAHA
jgi:membrane protease YdiL (CAAX protease family)